MDDMNATLKAILAALKAIEISRQLNPEFSYRDISLLPLGVVVGRYVAVLNCTFPTPGGGLVLAGRVDTAPASQTDFLFLKNGVAAITARFAAGSHTPTAIAAADTALLANLDYLDLQMPANLNGMAGPFCLALLGNVTG
jgi:hypothetical protein